MNALALRKALAHRVDRYLGGQWTARQLEAWVVNAYEEFDDGADPELAELLTDLSLMLAEVVRDERLAERLAAWLRSQGALLASGLLMGRLSLGVLAMTADPRPGVQAAPITFRTASAMTLPQRELVTA